MGKSSGEERRRSQAGDLAALEEALSILRRDLAEGRMQAADPDTASRQVAAAIAAAVRQGALRAATGLAAADASSAAVDARRIEAAAAAAAARAEAAEASAANERERRVGGDAAAEGVEHSVNFLGASCRNAGCGRLQRPRRRPRRRRQGLRRRRRRRRRRRCGWRRRAM